MTRYRWVVIGFAFIAAIITYMDRTALSYAITPIRTTFHLDNTEFGWIAAAFGIGYMIMPVMGGILVDRYGARGIWAIFAILWSIVCATMGLAQGFWWLFVIRLLLGMTEGPSFPSFERVITDWLPMSERARGIALGLAAVPLASVIGSPLITQLIAFTGWRIMFVCLGSLGVIWAVIWYVVFRNSPAESRHVNADELSYIQESPPELQAKTPWKVILTNPTLLANNFGFFAFGYLLFFSSNWLPGYFEQSYGIEIKHLGWMLMIPWITVTLFLLAGGYISDAIWRKTKSVRMARSHLIWICQLLSALSFVPVIFSHSLVVCLISLSLGMGFGFMPNSAFYAINADLSHKFAATSLGFMISAGAVSSILSPFLTGWLATLTGNFSMGFILMSSLMCVSALVIFVFQRPKDFRVGAGAAVF